jgi:hypothetical protein
LNLSILALTSLNLAGLFASICGIASFKSCFSFTWATASDSGSEAIRPEAAAGAVVVWRARVCASTAKPLESARRITARFKNFLFTTCLTFLLQNLRLVLEGACNALRCLNLTPRLAGLIADCQLPIANCRLLFCYALAKLLKCNLFVIVRHLKSAFIHVQHNVRKLDDNACPIG